MWQEEFPGAGSHTIEDLPRCRLDTAAAGSPQLRGVAICWRGHAPSTLYQTWGCSSCCLLNGDLSSQGGLGGYQSAPRPVTVCSGDVPFSFTSQLYAATECCCTMAPVRALRIPTSLVSDDHSRSPHQRKPVLQHELAHRGTRLVVQSCGGLEAQDAVGNMRHVEALFQGIFNHH